ncbi:hypothetical protein DVH24_011376 [Malus domestica]|uniref:Uncharacterized protein n=1 Tax=Malus domestica TaxID=3750 RepID=A0A498K123_MALDO|nr:hypothetical protein DVH24_011376 [Malus domestica]
MVLMVMTYSVGHNSGVHFNPAVWSATINFCVRAQIHGSTLATGSLRLIFNGTQNRFAGTIPIAAICD